MRILIAEDDEALAKFVRQGLEGENYSVDVFADGEQARSAATERDYDLVILGLNLPTLDGVSVLRYQNLGTTGSGDPLQVGAGTEVGSTPSLFTQGSVSSTGVSTDVAIQGAGFFVVQDPSGVINYTRAGDFSELNNYPVTASGQQVLGYLAVNGVINTGTGLGPLQLGAGTISPPTATTNVQLTTNLNAAVSPTDPPFSTPITVYDSLGASHILNFTFTNTGPGAWSYAVTIPAGDLGAGGAVQNGTGTLQFDNSGNLIAPAAGNNPTTTISGLADGAANLPFTWQLYSNGSGLLTQVAATTSSTSSANADGAGSGSLVKFAIGSDGVITGSFSNGKTQALGQLALATFANDDGLQLDGNTDFSPTLASGQAVLGLPTRVGAARFPEAHWSCRMWILQPSSPT